MPVSLQQARMEVGARLSEQSTVPYHNLNTWINDACRDIARRAECLQSNVPIAVAAQVQKYTLPNNLIRVHRMEYNPTGSRNIYPLEARGLMEMDQIWGISQQTIYNYPNYYALWQNPPNLQVILYPVPSQPGTLNCYYYRMPAPANLPTDLLDIPEGWQDIVYLYCEYVARRKDSDPAWKDAKEIYEAGITDIIDRTGKYHDQAGMVTTGTQMLPNWLYAMGDNW